MKFLLICWCFFQMGHFKDVPHPLTPISIDCSHVSKEVELSSIFNIECVPLETNEHCLIKCIEKIVASKNHWIVWDKKQNAVFSFGKNGKFINKITSVANPGSGEFKYCYDIDTAKDTLYLLTGKTIMLFDLNLHYLKKLSLPKAYSKFMVKEGWAYLYSSTQTATDREKVGVISLTNPCISIPLLKENRDLGALCLVEPLNFSYHNGEVLFSYLITDTIYALQGTTAYPKYILDFQGKTFAKHAFDRMPKDPYQIANFVNALDKTTYIYLPNRFIKNNLGVTFSFKMGNQPVFFFQNATNQTHFLTESFLLDGKRFNLVFAGATLNSMVASADTWELSAKRKEALMSHGHPINNSSNPTILIFSAL